MRAQTAVGQKKMLTTAPRAGGCARSVVTRMIHKTQKCTMYVHYTCILSTLNNITKQMHCLLLYAKKVQVSYSFLATIWKKVAKCLACARSCEFFIWQTCKIYKKNQDLGKGKYARILQNLHNYCAWVHSLTSWWVQPVINPRRACAARVTVLRAGY